MLPLITERISTCLGSDLVGLYVHGSYRLGDFHPDRSDLDLLAVLAEPPDAGTEQRLLAVHDQLIEELPDWRDRIEVDYLTGATAARLAAGPDATESTDAAGHRAGRETMIRISPGEPLHRIAAIPHYVINLASARQSGLALTGPEVSTVLPEIAPAVIDSVVREHAAHWPDWIQESRLPGAQAYAVLTLCRALHLVRTGRQLSKRQAGAAVAGTLPERAELIDWATAWWYDGGTDDAATRFDEVERFVRDVSATIEQLPPR